EAVDLARQLFLIAFPEEVDIRHDAALAAVLPLVADAGQQPAILRPDLDLRSHLTGKGDRRILVLRAFVETLEIERHLRTRTGNFENDADGLRRIVTWRGILRYLVRCRGGGRRANACLRLARRLGSHWRRRRRAWPHRGRGRRIGNDRALGPRFRLRLRWLCGEIGPAQRASLRRRLELLAG